MAKYNHKCSAVAPLALLLLLLLGAALLAPAASQEIKLVSGPGCADLPPSPPTNLKAQPGDTNVTLTWDKPANGACVTEYRVSVVPVDPTQRSFLAPPQKTPAFRLTISELSNDVSYRFYVQAFSAKYNAGGEAQVVAAPQAQCLPALLPSAPTALTARPGIGNVTLCWSPPKNGACVDEYRIAVTPAQQNGQRSGTTSYKRTSTTCVTISQLQPGQTFSFSVQAWSNALKGGAFATILSSAAAQPKTWRCMPVPGYYPLCSSAAAGRCTPLNCLQQVAKGQCNAPFMRIVDKASLTIVQHCSEVCGCSADPTLGTSPATTTGSRSAAGSATATAGTTTAAGSMDSMAEPRVQKFDGGVTASTAAAQSQAAATVEAAAAAGTRGQLSWESPDGCCAAPPRSRSFDAYGNGEDEGELDDMEEVEEEQDA